MRCCRCCWRQSAFVTIKQRLKLWKATLAARVTQLHTQHSHLRLCYLPTPRLPLSQLGTLTSTSTWRAWDLLHTRSSDAAPELERGALALALAVALVLFLALDFRPLWAVYYDGSTLRCHRQFASFSSVCHEICKAQLKKLFICINQTELFFPPPHFPIHSSSSCTVFDIFHEWIEGGGGGETGLTA